MFSGNQNQFKIAISHERLETLLDGMDAGNGTPLAPAIAVAIEVDRRISRASDEHISDISDDVLRDLAFDARYTFTHSGSQTVLPFGTILESKGLGEILIGGERWVLDAGRPGLFPIWTTRSDAHGPNLKLLHRHIARLTRNLACRRLGLPQPALVCDFDERHLLHFAPHPEAGGVVLQCWASGTGAPRFCAALPEQVEAFARAIVKDMRAFWRRRKDIARQGAEVRAIVEHFIADVDAEVEAIIVDMSIQFSDEDFDFYVHYLGVDDAMRRGLVLDYIPASRRNLIKQGHYFGPCSKIISGREELEAVRSHGADGRITELAAAVLASGAVEPEQLLAVLARSYDVTFELATNGAPIFGALYWADGTIRAELSRQGTLNWSRDRLELYGIEVPEAKRVAMTGRPISELAGLPFGGDILIGQIERINNGVRLHVGKKPFLIELASGKVRECPEELC
ncbi:hypothetical protein [Qipengyuania sp. JC766]|uniref:hypothetical protein n=1 Tax=Qipengyuania sp. JC766 TaxID=3232139 RepID=UPI003459AEE8